MLKGRKILIGITGGIAAYKIPLLVRLLVKREAEVKVIMTSFAREFVSPKTLSVLSKNQALTDFFDTNNNWNNHVDLAAWADVMLIAPATANTMAKMVSGMSDNLLTTVYLSATCPVFIAPAMDLDMYRHESTKANLDVLRKRNHIIIPAEHGELASGLVGEGRMAEPETILSQLENYFKSNLPLAGKKALVNAGPTYEAIDPVRFIGNRSSGKTGIAIADELAKRGAEVTLVLGPTTEKPFFDSVKCIRVESAQQMYEACIMHFPQSDYCICSAAVADYKPKHVSADKIKKQDADMAINLEKTKDIAAELGRLKKKQILVGFALETVNIEQYAAKKLKEKNLDMIVANEAEHAEGSVFGADTNQFKILDKNNNLVNFELMSKADMAVKIVDYMLQLSSNKY